MDIYTEKIKSQDSRIVKVAIVPHSSCTKEGLSVLQCVFIMLTVVVCMTFLMSRHHK